MGHNSIKTYGEAVAAVEASSVSQIIKRAFIETLNDADDGAVTDWKECYFVARKFARSVQDHQAAMDLIVAIDIDAIVVSGGAA